MPRWFLILSFLGAGFSNAVCQDDKSEENLRFIDHLYVGGDVGFNYTQNSSFFNLAPLIGYSFTREISAGIGLHYQWTSYRSLSSINTDTTINDHIIGGSVFARYQINSQFLLHAEYEILNTKAFDPFKFKEYRRNVPIFLVGAGWRYPMGPNSYMQLLILYDFIDDSDSPYPEYFPVPIIFRGGFIIELGKGMNPE